MVAPFWAVVGFWWRHWDLPGPHFRNLAPLCFGQHVLIILWDYLLRRFGLLWVLVCASLVIKQCLLSIRQLLDETSTIDGTGWVAIQQTPREQVIKPSWNTRAAPAEIEEAGQGGAPEASTSGLQGRQATPMCQKLCKLQ